METRTKPITAEAATVDETGVQDATALRADVSAEEAEQSRDQRVADLVPAGRRRSRGTLPLKFEAVLIRGLSFRLSYSDGSVIFWCGQKTLINKEELKHLSANAFDAIETVDPESEDGAMVKRNVSKFQFFERGDDVEIETKVPEYQPSGRQSGDPFDQAAAARAALRKRKRRT